MNSILKLEDEKKWLHLEIITIIEETIIGGMIEILKQITIDQNLYQIFQIMGNKI